MNRLAQLNRDPRLAAAATALVALILFALRARVGPIMGVDWASYLASVIIRTPLYPMFLRSFHFLFGEDWKAYAYLVQILMVLGAGSFFAWRLRRVFALSFVLYLPVLLLVLSPTYGHNGIGNKYYSEALAYSLYLLSFAFLFSAADRGADRDAALAAGFAVLAVLTRPQLSILYLPVLLLIVFVHLKEKNRKKTLRLAIVFGCAMAGGALFGRAYNYAVHGLFTSVPFSGMNLAIAPLYVADPERDVELFPGDSRERKLLAVVFARMEEEKYLLKYDRPPNFLERHIHYARSYDGICWGTVYPAYRKTFTTVSDADFWLSPAEFADLDRMMIGIALRIAPRHIGDLATLYAANILFKLGGYYYPVLLVAVMVLSAYRAWRWKGTLDFALFTITLLNLTNYALVGVLQRLMTRYTFYTDTLQLVFLLLWCVEMARAPRAGDEAAAAPAR